MVGKASHFNGDYVGGDKVYGDKVGRDKIIIGGEVITVRAGQHERRSIFPHKRKRLEYRVLIEQGATVDGFVLGKKVDIESDVHIGGSVCSWGDISVGKECVVQGDVISKRQVFLDAGCSVRNVAAEIVHFRGAPTIKGNIISLTKPPAEVLRINLFPQTEVQGIVQWPKGAIVGQRCKLGALFCGGDIRVEDNCEVQCLFTRGDVVLGNNVRIHILSAHDLLVDSANVDYLQCDGSLTVERSLQCRLLCTYDTQYQ